jgi:threonine/homoserine/homoserine lactone efflux protein
MLALRADGYVPTTDATAASLKSLRRAAPSGLGGARQAAKMLDQLVAFLGVALLVIVTPGQDTALTIRNTLLGGRRAGVCTVLGVVTGQASWTLATSAGLVTVLMASKPAFVALRLVGAAYLVFLGIQALLCAWRAGESPGLRHGEPTVPRLAPSKAYRQGLMSNLGNPKVAVFFTSLLPQFTIAGQTTFSALALLGLVFCSLTLAWLMAYALILATLGDVLGRSWVRRALEGLMGGALVALGLRLAAEHR